MESEIESKNLPDISHTSTEWLSDSSVKSDNKEQVQATKLLHSLLSDLPSIKDPKHKADFKAIKKSIENGGNINDWQLDGTPLQKAINKKNISIVRFLLEKGAKTYLPDEKYRLPIQMAAELELQKTAIALLENRSFVNEDYLNKIIEFCLEFYIGEEDFCKQDCGLLDFAASILTGKNINQLLQDKKNWIKYFGHLRQIKLPQDKDEVKKTVKVEGWHQEEILSARVRILLEVIINLELNKVASTQTSGESEKELLMKEILLEIESLHICHAFSAIKKFSSELQQELIESLATSILNGMKHFLKEPYGEYCMPSGWPTHSIYINFMLFPDGYIAPRIDNLGPRPVKCHMSEGASPAKYYPAFIGKTKINWQEEGEQNKLKKYIINLITTKMYPSPYPSKQEVKAREVARDKAKKIIYDQDADQYFERFSKSKDHVQKMLKDLGCTPEHSQEGGTCVVTNHNIGLRIRLKTESLYQRVLNKESAHLGLITYYSQIDINNYWQKFLSPRQLQQRILQYCKRHYLSQANITFLFPEYNLGQKKMEYIIPSLLKKEVKEIKENKKDKQKEGQSEKTRIKAIRIYEEYLKQDHPIFVEGQAGMGKSTLCRYIASRWSEHKLWRGKFALVVYIRLRNLNTNRYPSHCHYDICDVISKECLGGEKIAKLEKKRFEEILNSKKVLWLLDGYDELPKLSSSLENIVEEIFKKSQLIVTSRYPLPPHLTFKHCLEAAGFEEDDVSKYIDNFYGKFEHREQLKDFLHNHHAVKLIASTPINLEIICSIWSSDKTQLIEASSLTTTNLYYIITLWILRRFLIRNDELLTQSSGLKETSKLRNDNRIFRRLHFELKVLEKIAFSMMQKFEYYLTQKDFFDLMPERQDKEFENDVVDIGILAPTLTSGMEIPEWRKLDAIKISNIAQPIKDDTKSMVTSVSPSKDLELIESTNYEFIHASFQEFFTALYLVDSLSYERRTMRYKEAVEFLINKRYSSLLILEFTAGLLSLRKASQQACDAFWLSLSQPPYDLTQFNQVGILISCLQQALSCGADIRQIDKSVIDYINSVLNSIFRLNDRKNIKFDRLLRNIQSCDKVIAQPNLSEAHVKALSRIDYPIQIAAKLISQIDDSSRSIVTQKIKELLFATKDDRLNRYVAVTLAKDQEVQGRLLREAQDSSSPHQAAAVWILGQGPFNNPATITVLRANLQSVEPNVRFNSIKSLENLSITDKSVIAMLEEMAKNDKNRQVRLAAKEAWEQLSNYADYLEQDDGPPDDGFDIDDEPDINKDLADDEMSFNNDYAFSGIEDEEYLPKQSFADRWITDGYFSKEWRADDKEKKDGQKVLIGREINKRQNSIPLQVYDKNGKQITVTVSEQTLKQYKLLQTQGKNLSVEEVLALDDFSLKYLIEQSLYLTNTELESIIGAYINNDKDLLAKLIIKNVYETGIVVTIVKEGFRIYKGQNKDFNLLHAKELTIRNFIKTFNTFSEEYSSEKLTDPFEYTEHKRTTSPTTASLHQQLKVVHPETAPIVPSNSTSLLLTPTSSHNLSSNALAQPTNCLTSKREEKLKILTAQSSTHQTPSSQPVALPVLKTEQLADLKTLDINITDETVIQVVYTDPMQLKNIYANCYLAAEVKSIDARRAAYERLRQSEPFKALVNAKTVETRINEDLEIFGLTVDTAKLLTLVEAYERLWVQALSQGGQPNAATAAYESLRQFDKFRFLPIPKIVGKKAQQNIIKLNEKLIEEAQQAAQRLAQTAAKKYGLTLQNVPDKGNCFFDSVRDQLQQRYEITISADHLRIIAMQQMHRDPGRYTDSFSAGEDFSFKHVTSAALVRIKDSINLNNARSTLFAAALANNKTIEDVSTWSMDQVFNYCHQNPNAEATAAVLTQIVFPSLTSAEKVAAHVNAMLKRGGTVAEDKAGNKAAEYRKWADDVDVLAMSDALGISIISVQPTGQVPPAPPVSSSSSSSSLNPSLSSSISSSLSSNAAATSIQTTLHYYNQSNASASPPIVIAFTGMNHYQSLRGDTIQVRAAAETIELQRQGLALPPLNAAQLRELATKSLQEVATTFDSLAASRRPDKGPSDSSPLVSSSPRDHKSDLEKDKNGSPTSLDVGSAGASGGEKISSIRTLLVEHSPTDDYVYDSSLNEGWGEPDASLSSLSGNASSLPSSSSSNVPPSPPKMAALLVKSMGDLFSPADGSNSLAVVPVPDNKKTLPNSKKKKKTKKPSLNGAMLG